MRYSKRYRIVGVGLAGLVGAMLGTAPACADDLGGEVTAVIGEVVTGSGRVLENRSQIADDEQIGSGKDGALSILFDQDALVELCEETAVALERDPQTGQRRIRVESGAIRIVVEPREIHERLEIHTPAAIATILGTIVHISVDPVTGETTITGEENKVSVKSSDPTVPGATTVSAMEQLVIRTGAAPPEIARRLAPEDFERLAGCQVDFHAAASGVASRDLNLRAADRIATSESELGIWYGPAGSPAAIGPPEDDIDQPEVICSAVDCVGADFERDPQTIDPQEIQTTDGF